MQRDQAASRAERTQQRLLDLLGAGATLDPALLHFGTSIGKGTLEGGKGNLDVGRCVLFLMRDSFSISTICCGVNMI